MSLQLNTFYDINQKYKLQIKKVFSFYLFKKLFSRFLFDSINILNINKNQQKLQKLLTFQTQFMAYKCCNPSLSQQLQSGFKQKIKYCKDYLEKQLNHDRIFFQEQTYQSLKNKSHMSKPQNNKDFKQYNQNNKIIKQNKSSISIDSYQLLDIPDYNQSMVTIFKKNLQKYQKNDYFNLNHAQQQINTQKIQLLRDYENNFQNCIFANLKNTKKLFKVLYLPTSQYKLLKIIKIKQQELDQYLYLLKKSIKSQQFKNNRNGKKVFLKNNFNSLVEQNKYYQIKPINYTNQQLKNSQKNKQIWLLMLRKYYSGRSIFQQVKYYSRIRHKNIQLPKFIQKSITLLLNQSIFQSSFIPTLDNIYLTEEQIQLNYLSFSSYFYLKGINQTISPLKFKLLYLILDTDQKIYTKWKYMERYIKERIKIKTLFLMIYCFITMRIPDLLQKQYFQEKDLEYHKIQDKKSQINKFIQSLPLFWEKQLNEPRNRACLKLNKQKGECLYKLMHRIFVKEQKIGWKQLFQNTQFIALLKMNENVCQIMRKKNIQEILIQQFNKKYLIRQKKLKNPFVRLHKFIVGKDQQITKQFKQRCTFKVYLPLKIGLPLQFIFQYGYTEWYQIFLIENKDYRAEIYDSLRNLKKLINFYQDQLYSSGELGKQDLDKIRYIMSQKLSEIGEEFETFKNYNDEIEKSNQKFAWKHILKSMEQLIFTPNFIFSQSSTILDSLQKFTKRISNLELYPQICENIKNFVSNRIDKTNKIVYDEKRMWKEEEKIRQKQSISEMT